MFYSIQGKLIAVDEPWAILETGGVAYELMVTHTALQNLPSLGENCRLFVRMIVRENEQFLIGFQSPQDRKLFDSLLSVSGIGPKQALKILSELSAQEIRSAIVGGQEKRLAQVKGIGPKTASRIILELRDRMMKSGGAEIMEEAPPIEKKKLEALMAMRVLGYNDAEARKAIDAVLTDVSGTKDMSVEDIIKRVLAWISRN